ncbi:putative inactive receptor kinase At2g26730 [Apium graveolens]|uniref:putative inactive receptor kinase At2g26730 n=1 Tax=Apium graveolens TaxID=4045 RepID=UPI003D797B8D
MLSRAFTTPRKSFRYGETSCRSASIHEYEDCIVGFMDDTPLNTCHDVPGATRLTLREVLRGSVGVVGQSRLGMIEKVVLLGGQVCSLKRFREVSVKRIEFGRRIERLAEVSKQCRYLVPVTSYLYTRRIKFVVSHYFPMGSLADLLAGARELGHTALDWKQRLKIVFHMARAIAFIHGQSPSQEKHLILNVHGNIKSSNVMISCDFEASISDYGFVQLAERVKVSGTWQGKPPPDTEPGLYSESFSQKCDIYNFGIILLDLLAGPKAPESINETIEKKEEIKNGECQFFEFSTEGKARKQALKVLDIALACTNHSPEARPSMEQILLYLGDVIK